MSTQEVQDYLIEQQKKRLRDDGVQAVAKPALDTHRYEEEPDILDRVWDVLTSRRSGEYSDTVGKAVAHGAVEGVEQTAKAALSGAETVQEWAAERRGEEAEHLLPSPNDVPDLQPLMGLPELSGPTEEVLAGLTQFGVSAVLMRHPGAAGGQALKTAGAGIKGAVKKIAGEGAEGAVEAGAQKAGAAGKVLAGTPEMASTFALADAMGFDPNQGGLLAVLNEIPALEPIVSDWMAARDPDDPEWMNRAKSAIEGGLLGAGLGIGMAGIGALVEHSVEMLAHGVKANREGRALAGAPDGPKKVAQRNAANEEAARAGARIKMERGLAGKMTEDELIAKDARRNELVIARDDALDKLEAEEAYGDEGDAIREQFAEKARSEGINIDDRPLAAYAPRVSAPPPTTAQRRAQQQQAPESDVTQEQIRIMAETVPNEPGAAKWTRGKTPARMWQDVEDARKAFSQKKKDYQEKHGKPMDKMTAGEHKRALGVMEDEMYAAMPPELRTAHAWKKKSKAEKEDLWNEGVRRTTELEKEKEELIQPGWDGFMQRLRVAEETPDETIGGAAEVIALAHKYGLPRETLEGHRPYAELEREARELLQAWKAVPKNEALKAKVMKAMNDLTDFVADGMALRNVRDDMYPELRTDAAFRVHVRKMERDIQGVEAQFSRTLDGTDASAAQPEVVTWRPDSANPPEEGSLAELTDAKELPGLRTEEQRLLREGDNAGKLDETFTPDQYEVQYRTSAVRMNVEFRDIQKPEDFETLAADTAALRASNDAERIAHGVESQQSVDARNAEKVVRAEKAAAKERVQELLRVQGRIGHIGRVTHRLRDEIASDVPLDYRDVEATLENMTQSLWRLTDEAGVDGASSQQRSDAIHAWHAMDAYVNWLMGRTKDMDRAFDRMKLQIDEEAGDEVKRALKSNDLIAKSGGSQRVNVMMKAMGNTRSFKEAFQLWAQWRDVSKTAWSMGHRSGLRGLPDAAMALRFNGMLSAASTHAKNVIGNAAYGTVRIGEEFVIDVRDRDTPMGDALEAAAVRFMALKGAVQDAWFISKNDFLFQLSAGNDPLNPFIQGGALSAKARKAITSNKAPKDAEALWHEAIGTDKLDYNTRVQHVGAPAALEDWMQGRDGTLANATRMIGNGLQQASTYATKALQSEDVFFKIMWYRMTVAAEAAKAARKMARNGEIGTDNPSVAKKRDELMERPADLEADTAHAAIHKKARDLSRELTFVEEPVDMPTKKLLELRNKYPEISLAVPFVRVLSNLTRQALKRTPGVGLINRGDKWATRRGRAELQAQQLTGVMVFGAGAALAYNGRITGSAAGTPEQREALKRTGWRPRSLVVYRDVPLGDGTVERQKTYVSYEDIPGVGQIMGLTADAAHLLTAASNEEEYAEALDVADAIGSFLAQPFSTYWAESAWQMADALQSGNDDRILRTLAQVGVTFAPSGAMMRRLDTAQEGGERRTFEKQGGKGKGDEDLFESGLEHLRRVLDEVASRTILLSESGRPRRSIFTGKPLRTGLPNAPEEMGLGSLIGAAFSPLATSYEDSVPGHPKVVEEFHRVAPKLGWFPKTFRVEVSDKIPATVLEYTAEQQDYIDRVAGDLYGKKMAQWIRSPAYMNELIPTQKAIWQNVFTEAHQEAHRKLLETKLGEDILIRSQNERDTMLRRVQGAG